MRRERGFGWMELVIVLGATAALIAAAWGAVAWHAGVHFKRGQESKQAEWDKAKLDAAALERARGAAVEKALLMEEKRRLVAEQAAGEWKANFEEAKREARRSGVALGGCQVAGQDPAPDGAGGGVVAGVAGPGIRQSDARARDSGVRLTWEFVREYDGLWTGLDGQPVSALARGDFPAERASAFAPYRLEDIVDVAGLNAERCSADRRSLDTLIRKTQAAGAAWDSVNQK